MKGPEMTLTSEHRTEEGIRMASCISCMQREGDPRNGGLCYTCAPRGKTSTERRTDRSKLRIVISKVTRKKR